MLGKRVRDAYFAWISNLVDEDGCYSELLTYLDDVPFRYIMRKDEFRMNDGIELRHRFICDHPQFEDDEEYLNGPCSVLEVMVALALRCEETIMADYENDRTHVWFESMITSLGLDEYTDEDFDISSADEVIQNFLDRRYEANGAGGLFTINDPDADLRTMEIFDQMLWWLNTI